MRADPQAVRSEQPLNFEKLDQRYGLILYRTTIPAGPASDLRTEVVLDIGLVDLDGERIGSFDRRNRAFWLRLPEREKPAELAILVEAMGRVNFGDGIHDRKGLHGPPRAASATPTAASRTTAPSPATSSTDRWSDARVLAG